MINENYLTKEIFHKINYAFYENKNFPSISLQKFFKEDDYKKLKKEVNKLKFTKDVNKLTHSYKKVKSPEFIKVIFKNYAFKKYLSALIGHDIKKINFKIYSFGCRDYTILNDSIREKDGYELILDFSDQWDNEFGGKIVYTNGKGEHNIIDISPNTLTLVRNFNNYRYIQYVNHKAKNKKIVIVIGTILIN